MTTSATHAPSTSRRSLWRNMRFRAVFYQVLAVILVISAIAYMASNTLANLQARSIRTGFAFLARESGFRIGESVIAYRAADSYGRAYVVGILNTLRVSLLGILLATGIGVFVGICRLSPNWLVAHMASVYVEIVRNIPLLLQLFFWYALITHSLPPVSEAHQFVPGVYLSKSGLMFPALHGHPAHAHMLLALGVGALLAWGWKVWATRRQAITGWRPPLILPCLGLLIVLPLLVWLANGAPLAMDVPARTRFAFRGGSSVTPEFLALLAGLTLYTAAFIAENVRGGIQAVSWGQTEAAAALGLRRSLALRLVVLPQALRIIIPPTTSQYLNLTKNSSLAVAIGYPDLVSITNTSLNQTGQAIECIAIMMAIYLTISLSISAIMNVYNRYVALVER